MFSCMHDVRKKENKLNAWWKSNRRKNGKMGNGKGTGAGANILNNKGVVFFFTTYFILLFFPSFLFILIMFMYGAGSWEKERERESGIAWRQWRQHTLTTIESSHNFSNIPQKAERVWPSSWHFFFDVPLLDARRKKKWKWANAPNVCQR